MMSLNLFAHILMNIPKPKSVTKTFSADGIATASGYCSNIFLIPLPATETVDWIVFSLVFGIVYSHLGRTVNYLHTFLTRIMFLIVHWNCLLPSTTWHIFS